MSSVLDPRGALLAEGAPLRGWIPVAFGLAVLYVPTFFDLSQGLWTQDEHLHGPIVLVVAAWLAWQVKDEIGKLTAEPAPLVGWLLVTIGLLAYILGRSQEFILFEVGSQIPIYVGALLVTLGWRAVRVLWFPLLFLCFMIPLPGALVDALTNPLKHHVSVIAEFIMYWAGLPIARSGVVLSIGPYQLLVADACSGLHSIISMSAMGLLYVHLSGHKNVLRNGLLISTLVPIAFSANVVRVMVLVLVTYYFGDEAGQGFIHGFSGVFLFVVGLLFLFLIDGVLGRISGLRDRRVSQ